MKTETLRQEKLLRALRYSAIPTTPVPRDAQRLTMIIQGVIERFDIHEDLSITIGRFDATTRTMADLDLTPYNGVRKGVSRRHARLHIDRGTLYLTDLGSSNGTFVGGKRLDPNKPVAIRKENEVLTLGGLNIQLFFRQGESKA